MSARERTCSVAHHEGANVAPSERRRNAFEGADLILVDGNNLLHRQGHGTSDGALRALLGRLQQALPNGVRAVVFLDGQPAQGPAPARPPTRTGLRYAGPLSADDAIVHAVQALPFAARATAIVVTSDRALGDRVRSAGAFSRQLDWLQERLAGPDPGTGRRAAPALGAGRRARPAAAEVDAEVEREPWRPGRGATRKKGNPRRPPSRQR